MKNLLLGLIAIVLGVGIVFGVYYGVMKKSSPLSQPQVAATTAPLPTKTSMEVAPTVTGFQKGDINHDGLVNTVDTNIIQAQFGCKSTDPCWKKVIGKTLDGDNPIYTFDIDFNKDSIIDQKDIEVLNLK